MFGFSVKNVNIQNFSSGWRRLGTCASSTYYVSGNSNWNWRSAFWSHWHPACQWRLIPFLFHLKVMCIRRQILSE